jgi:phytoene synthase
MKESLDALVRRVDEDRWLATRFASKKTQTRLIALYALNYEIARTAEQVSNPTFGDIRQAWWSEAVEEIYAGKPPRGFPALQAYAEVIVPCGLKRAPLEALIVARGKDLDAAPFSSWDELELYLEATAGNLMLLAAQCALGGHARPAALADLARAAGLAWGYVGLLRAEAFWRARGRSFYPTALAGRGDQALRAIMMERAHAAYGQARTLASLMPDVLFPAIGYVALCKNYLARLGRGQDAQTSLFSRQVTLVWTSATGRI